MSFTEGTQIPIDNYMCIPKGTTTKRVYVNWYFFAYNLYILLYKSIFVFLISNCHYNVSAK